VTSADLRLALRAAANVFERGERPVDAPTHWTRVSIRTHLAKALIHLEKAALGVPSNEDDLINGLCRVLLAAELRERARAEKQQQAHHDGAPQTLR
jgi:hypothetical protein